jgi:uncharacterized protein with HEPN domain
MKIREQKLLFDVVESGRSIQTRCAGRTFADYQTDRQLRRAIEREFEIIGEALSRLLRIDSPAAQRISQLPRIISFRNRIIHGYDTIDDATVWGVIEGHLFPSCWRKRMAFCERAPMNSSWSGLGRSPL